MDVCPLYVQTNKVMSQKLVKSLVQLGAKVEMYCKDHGCGYVIGMGWGLKEMDDDAGLTIAEHNNFTVSEARGVKALQIYHPAAFHFLHKVFR